MQSVGSGERCKGSAEVFPRGSCDAAGGLFRYLASTGHCLAAADLPDTPPRGGHCLRVEGESMSNLPTPDPLDDDPPHRVFLADSKAGLHTSPLLFFIFWPKQAFRTLSNLWCYPPIASQATLSVLTQLSHPRSCTRSPPPIQVSSLPPVHPSLTHSLTTTPVCSFPPSCRQGHLEARRPGGPS